MYLNYPAIGATIVPQLGGIIGGYCIRNEIKTWYPKLKKPNWCPPNWAFAPVWGALYTGMGYASYLTYRDGEGFKGPAGLALGVYGANLALNWAWSPIFFNAHKLKLAFYEILLLDCTAIASGILFYKINNIAGYLFIPYTMWLCLATALTYRLYKDNEVEPQTKTE